jgi:hypothetical protein
LREDNRASFAELAGRILKTELAHISILMGGNGVLTPENNHKHSFDKAFVGPVVGRRISCVLLLNHPTIDPGKDVESSDVVETRIKLVLLPDIGKPRGSYL